MIDSSFFSIKYRRAQSNLLDTLNNLFFVLMLALLVFLISFRIFYTGAFVFGVSMYPTLNSKGTDTVYINHYEDYTYGDIIALHKSSKTDIIKRVIAFEGDRIDYVYNDETRQYEVHVNGEKLTENYTVPLTFDTNDPSKITRDPLIMLRQFHKEYFEGIDEFGYYATGCYIVPEACVFVMGDNRPKSTDSRHTGAFNKKDIIGKVEHIIPSTESRFQFFVKLVFDFENMFHAIEKYVFS